MKTLSNHTILYDDECPMCNLYTKGFVNSGMLDQDGRVCYANAREKFEGVDWDRARNEIALVRRDTGSVTYGIDSLFAILSNTLPFLKPLFACRAFRWPVSKMYRFISFNRKVIAPGSATPHQWACVPDFNVRYRVAFIIVGWLLTSTIVAWFSGFLVPIVPHASPWREYSLGAGLFLVQWLVAAATKRSSAADYMGNMTTVSVAGALTLLVLTLFTSKLPGFSPVIAVVILMVVLLWMFFEHCRRVKLLRMHWVMSATWIGYRFIALLIIL